MEPNKTIEPQNSSGRKDLPQEQGRFGKLLGIGQSSSHAYPRLCNDCESVWKQPFEQLGPILILGDEQYDLWSVYGPRRAAQNVRASIDFGYRICSLYWESISRTTMLDGTKLVDQAEHTARYFLEWDKKLLRFQTFSVERWPQQGTHFQLLPERAYYLLAFLSSHITNQCQVATSLPKGYEEDISVISENTAGENCWKFISEKFRACTTAHKNCTAYSEGERRYPTRLIHISNYKSIHLVDGNSDVHHEHASYMTLSHRWSEHTPKLTRENITSWLKNIPFNDLTQTFRDAINVARRLDSHYLWIDSLCIIQDCSEDWEKESASMGEVYRRCICNIAATAASDGSDSLFMERSPYSIPRFTVEIGWNDHRTSYSFARSDIWELGVINSNLNRRGWVIQERLLSPRTISFGSQIFWECHELEACETWADGLPAGLSLQGEWSDVWHSNVLGPKSWPWIISRPSQSSDDPYRVWKTIVRSYTNSGLTKEEDRLVALSGVVQQMQIHLNDQYVAGLWRRDLFSQLIWYTAQLGSVKRPIHYRGEPICELLLNKASC